MALAAPAHAEPDGSAGSGAPPRRRRQARLKAEIFRVAIELFAKRGYDHVTIDEIAAAADIAKGTFFNYFPTKEHVLLEYRHQLLDDIHAFGDALEGDSARELVHAYFRALSRRVRAEGERYEMLFKEIVARPHLIALDRSRQGRYRTHFDRFLETGKRTGEIPGHCDVELLAETIRDLWTGTSVTWLLENPSSSLESLVLRKIDFLFDLLDTRPGAQKETTP
jgi:AcrR family transcriptional regulator